MCLQPVQATLKKIGMSDLRLTLSKMRATGSVGEDDISLKNIKQAQGELEPLLLNLVNSIISTTTFPSKLKTSKVIPIPKTGKDDTTAEGWRPVNVVASLAKIIERVMLKQIMKHLEESKVIGHAHHGALRQKSTQTLVTELHQKTSGRPVKRNRQGDSIT